jgi:hypothetical protein
MQRSMSMSNATSRAPVRANDGLEVRDIAMRYLLPTFGLAVLLALSLSLPIASSHGLGTGANTWETASHGWPMEIWSTSVHRYCKPNSKEWVVISRQCSVHWKEAALLFSGIVPVAFGGVIVFWALRGQ